MEEDGGYPLQLWESGQMCSLSVISISNWVSGELLSKYLVSNFLDIYLQIMLWGLCPGWGAGRSLMDKKSIDEKL